MTGGRRGGSIVVLVPFVDVLHGYFDLDLLHIVALASQVVHSLGLGPARIGIRMRIAVGHCQLSAQAGAARRQPLLLLGDGGQQRLVPVL